MNENNTQKPVIEINTSKTQFEGIIDGHLTCEVLPINTKCQIGDTLLYKECTEDGLPTLNYVYAEITAILTGIKNMKNENVLLICYNLRPNLGYRIDEERKTA